jgi:hypothetical protein
MSLTIQYLGLAMKNPAIASASLLNGRIDGLRPLGCCHPCFRGSAGGSIAMAVVEPKDRKSK